MFGKGQDPNKLPVLAPGQGGIPEERGHAWKELICHLGVALL